MGDIPADLEKAQSDIVALDARVTALENAKVVTGAVDADGATWTNRVKYIFGKYFGNEMNDADVALAKENEAAAAEAAKQ